MPITRHTGHSHLFDAMQEARQAFSKFGTALSDSQFALEQLTREVDFVLELGEGVEFSEQISGIRYATAAIALDLERLLPKMGELANSAKEFAGAEHISNVKKGWTRAER